MLYEHSHDASMKIRKMPTNYFCITKDFCFFYNTSITLKTKKKKNHLIIVTLQSIVY